MIRCVAIDDEPIALSIIREHCSRLGGIELECFTSPAEGMERVRQWRPQLVLLDIEMGSCNGIELARQLPHGTCVIFTTAYAAYALDGFEVDAVDFLHKPIFYARFEKAMEKAHRRLSAVQAASAPQASITLKAEYKNVVIDLDDLVVVEAMENYVKLYRCGQPVALAHITLKEMEAMLPSGQFRRIHRSYIIAVRFVERYTNRTVTMRYFPRPLPVGRKYGGEWQPRTIGAKSADNLDS